MYCALSYYIPEKYFNLIARATDSYYKDGKFSKDRLKDYKKFIMGIRAYKYFCINQNTYSIGWGKGEKWEKIIIDFEKKRNEWLNREGFENISTGDPDRIRYWNKLMSIEILNYNTIKERWKDHLYPDYEDEYDHY